MTNQEIISQLENLHQKILHSSFCEKVYESEMMAVIEAKELIIQDTEIRAKIIDEFLEKIKELYQYENSQEELKHRQKLVIDFSEINEIAEELKNPTHVFPTQRY